MQVKDLFLNPTKINYEEIINYLVFSYNLPLIKSPTSERLEELVQGGVL